ncbi:hypothetical protein Tco_0761583, partial [Tanacetum coccineum]
LAFMAWNMIACLHGMNVIAYFHDMVDKLTFMAWLLACLCGMDRKYERKELEGPKLPKSKLVLEPPGFDNDDDDVLGVLAWIQGCFGLEAWTNGRFEASLEKLAKDVSYGLMIDRNDAYVMNDV